MNAGILGIGAFILILALMTVGVIVVLSLVKLAATELPHGARVVNAWLHRAARH